jgi:hypothetical protein
MQVRRIFHIALRVGGLRAPIALRPTMADPTGPEDDEAGANPVPINLRKQALPV